MIQVSGLEKKFGTQLLFDNVSFNIRPGDKVGFVGRNGSGKSTLFKILMGEEFYDKGQLVISKNYQIGSLKQHLIFSHPNILEECLSVLDQESVSFEKYKAEKMLAGLGFTSSDYKKSPSEFSGGYQIRLNLCKLLLSEPDCLLLDEPTNYLDIVSMRWLSKFLREFKGELILITHDRGFMDEVTNHTMGLWRNKLLKIYGVSDKYFEQVLLEEENFEKTRLNHQKKKAELQTFVDRFRAKASKANQVQSRLKLLEKMPHLEALSLMPNLDFEFNFKECPGKVLVEAKELNFGYNENKIIQGLSFSVLKNDKIAIVGKNGKGKSTLLNLLAGELQLNSGSIDTNVNILIGHFGQTNINRLNLENTIEQEIMSANPMMGNQRARSIAGAMMFPGDLSEKKIKVLSGGERSRVLLGKLLARPTNLLLLDEPTNHLDQASVDSLTLELQNYPGAVVLVTHSESLLRNFAQKLIVFHRNKVEIFNQSYQEFLEKFGWENDVEEENISTARSHSKFSFQEIKKIRAEMIVQRGRELNPIKKRMSVLEEKIIQHEEEQALMEAELIELSSKKDSTRIQTVSQRLASFKDEINQMFEELLILNNQQESILKRYDERLKDLDK